MRTMRNLRLRILYEELSWWCIKKKKNGFVKIKIRFIYSTAKSSDDSFVCLAWENSWKKKSEHRVYVRIVKCHAALTSIFCPFDISNVYYYYLLLRHEKKTLIQKQHCIYILYNIIFYAALTSFAETTELKGFSGGIFFFFMYSS